MEWSSWIWWMFSAHARVYHVGNWEKRKNLCITLSPRIFLMWIFMIGSMQFWKLKRTYVYGTYSYQGTFWRFSIKENNLIERKLSIWWRIFSRKMCSHTFSSEMHIYWGKGHYNLQFLWTCEKTSSLQRRFDLQIWCLVAWKFFWFL